LENKMFPPDVLIAMLPDVWASTAMTPAPFW
jgi:hypothetical protein